MGDAACLREVFVRNSPKPVPWIWALLALALWTTSVGAQRPAIGLSAGINRFTLTGGSVEGRGDARTGASVGVIARLSIVGGLAVEPEVLLLQHEAGTLGYEITCVTVPCNPIGSEAVRITSIQVPLLLSADLPTLGRAVRPFLVAGPSAAFRLGCSRMMSDGAGGQFKQSCSSTNPGPLVDPYPYPPLPALQSTVYQTFDVSLLAGAGVEVRGLVLQARVERGLRDVERSVPFAMSQLDRSKLLGVSVSVGFWIPARRH
jgi:hypothetical protein